MDIKFNYNDTISTVNSSKPSVVDSGKKDPVLLKSDKSSDTVLPITQVENEVNTDDVITSSGKRYVIEIGDKDETYTTDHTRNFYRGRSFRFAGPWTEGVHYISDNYVVDFVVKDNTLLACTKSHMSSSENEPTEWVIEDGQKRGVISDYWDLVIAGVPGKQGEDGSVYLPSYDEETDRLVWTLVPAEDLDSPIYVYLGITDRINSAIDPINERITQLNSEILDLNLITTSLSERVSDNEGNIGQLWLKADEFGVRMENAEGEIGQLTLTAHEFNVQMSNIQGDVGRLWLTAEEFGVRMSNAEGDISQLTQTAGEIQTRVENAEGDISQIHQRADEIWTQVENNQGDISRISQRADQIQSQVENNAGDISTLTQRADEISSQVENAQGDISQIRQTASEISSRVENNAGDISQLRQTATEISATVESNKQLADDAIAENRSLISQTAEQIRTEVESNVTRLDGEIEQNRSEIRQTAEEITTTVERNKQETDGAIESARSEFKQTADEISATVERNKIDVDGQIDAARSEIRQTADEITATVEANKRDTDGSIAELNSTITQTAEEIRADVSRVETDLTGNIESAKSEFRQTADEISTTVEQNKQSTDGAISNLSSEISQTAEQIRSEVSASITDVNGQITETRSELRQTADEITATVEANKSATDESLSNLSSEISQTAESITATVEANKAEVDGSLSQLSSKIEQTAEEISSTVEANKQSTDGQIEQLTSTVTQTATEIRSEVSESITDINDNLATAKSEIDQLSDEIDLKVSQAEFDSKTGDLTQSISDILVDTSGIHQTVSAISGSLDTTTSAFNTYVLNTNGVLEEIQKQIDGAIETWFYPYAPIDTNPESADYNKILTNVAPYSEWLAEDTESGGTAVRDAHIADIFYDTASGFAYRFTSIGEGVNKTYNWTLIEDSAVVRALRDAATAQATADGKMTVFVQTPPAHPEPPYNVGDLWAQGSLEGKNGLIYKCVVAKTENQTYSSNDWALAFDAATTSVVKSSFEVFADGIQMGTWQEDYNGTLIPQSLYSSIKTAVDNIRFTVGKVGSALLPTGINIADQYIQITANNFKLVGNDPNSTEYALEMVYDENGVPRIKAKHLEVEGVFSTQAWSTNLQTINSNISTAESNAKSYANDKVSDALSYLDDEVVPGITDAYEQAIEDLGIPGLTDRVSTTEGDISTISNSLSSAITRIQANEQGLSDLGYLSAALLDGRTVVAGGLVLSSLIQLGTTINDEFQIWSGINGVYVEDENSAAGHGIAAWYGGDMLDRYYSGNTDANRAAKTLFRMDGSGYLASNNLWWGANGELHINSNTIIGDSGNLTIEQLASVVTELASYFVVVDYTKDGTERHYLKLNASGAGGLDGFVSDGFISAGGLSTGGGAEGVDIIAVWQSLTNQSSDTTYNNTKIARAHLPIASKTELGAVKIGDGLAITSDGTISSASGTVTSIGLSMPTEFTVTSSPVTSSGTITVTFADGYSLPSTSSQTAWDAKYDKPATGIPKSDLAKAVKDSLDLADSALQSHQTLGLYAGNTGGTANSTTAKADPYILLVGNSINQGNVQLKGGSNVSISAKSGVVTFAATDTLYTLTLNGQPKGTTGGINLGSIYAPESVGTSNQILMANSSGIPTWHSLMQSDVFGSSDIGSISLPVYYNGTNGLSVITSLSLQGDIVTTTKVKAPRFYLTDDIYFVVDEHGVKLEGAGFYTDEFVSAGGYSPGGGAEGISWEALTGVGEQQINISHLNTALSNYVNTVTNSGSGDFVTGISKSGNTVTISYGNLPDSVKNPHSLTVGTKSYDGSVDVTIIASDLGISDWATASTKPSYGLTEISGTTDLRLIEALTGAGFLKRNSDNTWELDNSTYLTTSDAANTYLTITDAATSYQPLDDDLTKIAAIGTGTGLLKRSVSNNVVTWSIDTNKYLTGNQKITLSGDVTGSGTTSITVTIGDGKVTNSMLAGSIANEKLANSSITINGSEVSLGGTFTTADITAGTAGQSTASTGAATIAIPYVTVNKYGIVTGYGTHTHTIDDLPNSALKYSSVTIGTTKFNLGDTKTTLAGLTKVTSTVYSAGGKLEDDETESTITYDAVNHAWKITGNLYATGFVSAGGLSNGGGAEGISWEALTTSGEQKIHSSHLPITLTQGEGNYVTGITYSAGEFVVTRASLATTIGWDSVDDKPTTLAGYGITDGVNKVTVSGSGNAVTTASISGHTLTLTKGTTFLTAHQTVKLETGTNNGTLKLTVGSTVTDNIAVKGLGAAAYKAVGSISSGNTGLVTGGDVYSAINDTVTSAIKFRGVTSSELSDGDTSSTIIIDNKSYTANTGDLVLSEGLEFLWTGSKWQLLGDESSYALKTTTINGHALSDNVTVTASDVGLGNVTNLAATGYFTLFEMDSTDTTKTSITIGGTNKKLVIGYATKAKQDADGNEIKTSYGASLGAAANALTLKSKSGATLSTITAANIVTVLGNTAVGRATGDKNGNDIYNTYVSGVAVGTGSGNTNKLAITKAGDTTYITVPYATLANTVTTTADTTNTLYLVGVTSNATTTLKRNTGITMKNGELSVSKLIVSTNGITVTKGGITISAGGLTVTGDTTLSNKVYLGSSKSYKSYDSDNGSFLEWDSTNNAWHVVGNFYADGFVSAGGLNTSGSSSTGTSFVDYAYIKTMSSDADFTTASAWATHLFYQDVFGSGNSTIVSRITALENSSTNVQYTAKQSSGTEIGTITIDGTANKIYVPTIPTSLKNPKALSFGTQSYDGSAAKTIEAKDLSACVVGTVVGTVTITT